MLFNSVYGKNSGGGGGRLPVGFQEVEYIQSSGTQYINTGFKFTQETGEIKTKMMSLEMVSTYHQSRFAGAYNTNNTRSFLLYNNCTPVRVGIGADDYNTGFTMAVDTIYEIDVETSAQGSCDYTLNGSTTSLTWTGSLVTDRDYYIFCGNENGHPSNYGKDRLYYFKIYEGGTIVRDLVPCYNKTTGVIGLFDLVNYTFYSNAGTGTFTKGPDVSGGWQPGANTVAYYPLNSTSTNTDQSGNGNNGTTTGTIIYDSISAQFSSGNYITIPKIIPYGSNPYTISVRYKTPDSSGHQNSVYCQVNTSVNNTASNLFVYQGHLYYWSKGSYDREINSAVINNNTWYNIVFTYSGTQLECFVNNVSQGTFNRTISSTAPDVAYIGRGVGEVCIGTASNLIIENKVRTAQEISDYYNQTKGDYGIS